MTAATLTLTEFLLARIAEERALAETVLRDASPIVDTSTPHMERADGRISFEGEITGTRRGSEAMQIPASRVLAECEAKRRIINDAATFRGLGEPAASMVARGLEHAMSNMALIYADHPDYRDEWRP